MVTAKILYISRLQDMETGKIIEEVSLFEKKVTLHHSFDHLGLRQREQIKLIKNA